VVKFNNGLELSIDELSRDIGIIIEAIKRSWSYDKERGHWFRGNVKFKRMRGPILEVFDFGEYSSVDVGGKVVVDVGAFVGTRLYTSPSGALGGLSPLSPTQMHTAKCSRT
jgi:hypothetical protein